MGRTPWSAADAHVGFFRMTAQPDQGSGADEGVRPTPNFGDTTLVDGRLDLCGRQQNAGLQSAQSRVIQRDGSAVQLGQVADDC